MSELAWSSKEARTLAALQELARKSRDRTDSLSDAVDVCAWTLAVIGMGSDGGAFLHRCVAAGLSPSLGAWLWQSIEARRAAADRHRT